MVIREYKAEDRDAIEKCIFELQENEYNVFPRYWADSLEASKTYIPYLLEKLEKNEGKLLVAELDGNAVGLIGIMVDSDKVGDPCWKINRFAYITDFVVLEKYRKRGIGHELLTSAEKYAKEIGMEFITLNVQIGNSAMDLYQKEGFKERSIWMDKKIND